MADRLKLVKLPRCNLNNGAEIPFFKRPHEMKHQSKEPLKSQRIRAGIYSATLYIVILAAQVVKITDSWFYAACAISGILTSYLVIKGRIAATKIIKSVRTYRDDEYN